MHKGGLLSLPLPGTLEEGLLIQVQFSIVSSKTPVSFLKIVATHAIGYRISGVSELVPCGGISLMNEHELCRQVVNFNSVHNR